MSHERAFTPGLGHAFLTPLYDLVHRLSGLGRLHDEMLTLADLRPCMRVLDVGCATGNLLLTLGRRYPGVEPAGLDPDARALARAARKSRRAGLTVDWRRGFAEELPYPDQSLDRVFSSLMLHHLEPPAKDALLAEVRRVLRPEGLLVLADMDGHDAMSGHGFRHRSPARSPHVEAGTDIAERVAAAGFQVEPTTVYRLAVGRITIVRARP